MRPSAPSLFSRKLAAKVGRVHARMWAAAQFLESEGLTARPRAPRGAANLRLVLSEIFPKHPLNVRDLSPPPIPSTPHGVCIGRLRTGRAGGAIGPQILDELPDLSHVELAIASLGPAGLRAPVNGATYVQI